MNAEFGDTLQYNCWKQLYSNIIQEPGIKDEYLVVSAYIKNVLNISINRTWLIKYIPERLIPTGFNIYVDRYPDEGYLSLFTTTYPFIESKRDWFFEVYKERIMLNQLIGDKDGN
jgi:hypothetical protein